MDLDAYVVTHAAQWRRLEDLLARRRLSGPESEELVECYQQVATQLSVVRSSVPDAALVAHLSSLLARARNRSVGTRVTTWRGVTRFFTARFPAALYRLRWWWLTTAAVSVLATAVMILWLLEHPTVEQSLLTPIEIEDLVTEDFERYYSESAASRFAAQVWVNNAWVTALCLALGILGLPVVWLLTTNLMNLAVVAAVMIRNERAGLFWGLLLPHGLLELTAVFVAGGVGLRLFWSWVEPGRRSRADALAHEGRTLATVALGLVAVLLVAGLIEAYVTPSPLPTWARLGIGVLALGAFLGYVFGVGRAAYRRGETGDIDQALLEDRVATA